MNLGIKNFELQFDMKYNLTPVFIVLCVFTTFACKPEAEFELPYLKKQLVVDGWIEQNGYPMVQLTYNTPYFSNLDSASFRALVATRAKVSVTVDNVTEILTGDKDTSFFPPYIYRGTGEIIGKAGKTYTLKIEDELDTIEVSTTIPKPVYLDSVWFEANSPTDSMGIIKAIFSDNGDEKNYYRTLTKEYFNNQYVPTLISIFDDKYFNGQRFTFSLKKGPASYIQPSYQVYFKKGNIIKVKVQTLDKTSYDFWTGYQKEVLNSGNPFAGNHSKIESNIQNGLGIWAGYGISEYKVYAK
jgi:hypothetical protein